MQIFIFFTKLVINNGMYGTWGQNYDNSSANTVYDTDFHISISTVKLKRENDQYVVPI